MQLKSNLNHIQPVKLSIAKVLLAGVMAQSCSIDWFNLGGGGTRFINIQIGSYREGPITINSLTRMQSMTQSQSTEYPRASYA
jgi:hypothetical protein